MQEKYQVLVKGYDEILKKDNTVFNIMAYSKLTLILILAGLLYLIVIFSFPLHLCIMFMILLTALVLLWRRHSKLYDRIHFTKGQRTICTRQIQRITGAWTTFSDVGEEFTDPGHPYAADLDIVGQKSLFQYLNTTKTWHGRQTFARDLLTPNYGKEHILKRQKAIGELSAERDFCHELLYHLTQCKNDANAPVFIAELQNDAPFLKAQAIKFILRFLPVFSAAITAVFFLFWREYCLLTAVCAMALQGFLWILGIAKTNGYLGSMAGLNYKLSAFHEVIDFLRKKEFSSELLQDIQKDLERAAKSIEELGKIADRVSMKHNGIVWIVLNVLLLWDYENAFFFDKWKRDNGRACEAWFWRVGELESLLCFSHLPGACSETTLPEIVESGGFPTGTNHRFDASKVLLQAKELGHPLLQNEVRIPNDLQFGDRILIISGSNMSGKTTFLRTVGINLVLARAGSFVCAKQMLCTPLRPVTSMRITDDLSRGISTFYAELKRIKMILEEAETHKDILFLIDEIFKGTNSGDRLEGAKRVVAKLNQQGVPGMLSTHDLELCTMEAEHERVENYSFSEHYEDGKLCFDYKMRPGQSKTTNGRFLMEMLGIG